MRVQNVCNDSFTVWMEYRFHFLSEQSIVESIRFTKVLISGPRSRQSSVENNDSSMNTEEVYRNLRKTTAEIQNYSFETKLGRDTNSKDSGISQMDDQQSGAVNSNEFMKQQAIYNVNQYQQCGINGHNGNYFSCGDKEDSYNGSKTQSAATTESNTPENTVRIDGEIMTRTSFTAKHSNNVTFLPNGELVTECKRIISIFKICFFTLVKVFRLMNIKLNSFC